MLYSAVPTNPPPDATRPRMAGRVFSPPVIRQVFRELQSAVRRTFSESLYAEILRAWRADQNNPHRQQLERAREEPSGDPT